MFSDEDTFSKYQIEEESVLVSLKKLQHFRLLTSTTKKIQNWRLYFDFLNLHEKIHRAIIYDTWTQSCLQTLIFS